MDEICIVHSFGNKIGYGSYADVYLVYDDKGKALAYKVFKDDPRKQIVAVETLGKELEVIKRIKHPLIVPLVFSGKVEHNQEEKYVMITEFFKNGTLSDILALDPEKQAEIGWNSTKKLNFIYLLAIQPFRK